MKIKKQSKREVVANWRDRGTTDKRSVMKATKIMMGVTTMTMIVSSSSSSSSSSSPSSLWLAAGGDVKRRRRAPNSSSSSNATSDFHLAFIHGSRRSRTMSKGILVDSDNNNIVALKMVWRDASSRGTNNSNANNNNNSNNNNNNGPSRRTIQSQEPTRSTRTTTSANSGGSTTSTNSRNRGANAANHNRRGHTLRLNNKASVGDAGATTATSATTTSSKRTMNTKRPPRWEREGDNLYAEVTKELDAITYHDNDDDDIIDNNDNDDGRSSSNIRALLMQLANIDNEQITPNDVCQLLEPWTTSTIITEIAPDTSKSNVNDKNVDNIKAETIETTTTAEEAINLTQDNLSNNNNEQNINNNGNIQNTKEAPATSSSIPKNFLWGTLPVGPVLAQRLYNSGRQHPTSVQIAAFPILSASVPMTAQQQQQQQQQSNNGGYNSNSRSNRGRSVSSNHISSNNINSSSRWTSTGPTTAIAATTRSNKTKSKINNTTRNKQRINGIIASPTGTGKTLAYLLPLLCTSPGGQQREGLGGVLIVTPTIELACQIQREVDVLWPPLPHSIPPLLKAEEEKGGGEEEEQKLGLSSLFVVGDVHQNDKEEDDDDDSLSSDDNSSLLVSSSLSNNISPGRMILRSIEHTTHTIIAGTPKMLRALYKEAGRIVSSSEREGRYSSSSSRSSKSSNNNDDDDNIIPITPGERATATALLTNLRAIVLDEADRLLRTEAVAREMTERKNRKAEQRRIEEEEATAAITTIVTKKEMANNKKRPPKLIIARQTQTEYLLRDIPVSLDAIQIICASATVGRTMRRQLMQILNKNSADAAATLITGSDDLRVKSKDMDKRKSVLLPERLQHAYRVVTEDDTDYDNVIHTIEQEEDDEEEVDNVDDANEEEFTFDENIGTSNFIMPSVRNEDERIKQTINALWSTMMMSETKAKPIIIFPGRLGVERVKQELMSRGLTDVRTLRNLDGKRGKTPPLAVTDDGITNKSNSESIDNKDNKWKSIPVYIIGERFARGLDLPEVEYVFMLSPPSSAAGYAHMAGRTGRSGRTGLAFTLVRPRNNEVQRLAAIADALGLKFMSSMSGVAEKVGQE